MKKAFGKDYLFEKPHWAYATAIIDSLGGLLFKRSPLPLKGDVKKILLSRIDHLGDVFIASSITRPLKEAFPGAQIHFLAGPWAEDLLKYNPHIDKTIIYSSFRHNRSGGLFKRLFHALVTFFSALVELRRERYDIAIDLRAYFFNSLPLIALCGARCIAGFPTGGFGFLLHYKIPYRTGVHETDHIKDILKEFGIEADEISPALEPSQSDVKEAERVLNELGFIRGEGFALLHTGSGNPKKLWKRERWQELIDGIRRTTGLRVLLYDEVYDAPFRNATVLKTRQSIGTFAAIASRAAVFIGLDSFPAHLAAAAGRPVVVLWCGMNDPVQWRPLGRNVRIVKKELDCSPCGNINGCPDMECMDLDSGVILSEVIEALKGAPDRALKPIV